jgi:sterol desaturase/sphingolipid hydroxylase (fatty acid hydroxylase superfamily)|tara:strand:- start:931 stop:1773 length:843 start_codon:yes stop_codon:yes gene_type:complete
MTQITITDVYSIGVPIILALIFFEVFISNWQSKSFYKAGDTYCTSGLLFGNIIMGFVIKSSIVAFHFVLYEYRFFDLMSSMPIWLLWVLTFILIDLVFYIYHRMSHRVRFLWTVHMSHHSSEEMNFAVSFRQAWFGPISKIPFFMVLPILGLDPLMIAVAGVVSTLWGVVGHTQIIGKLGPLEWVFNTPSHHRVHHGSNPEYIDKNYGNLFIIWDRIFGTFEPENKPVEYGLVNNVNTFNPIKITFMGWEKLFKDIRNSESFKETIGLIFGPPETHSKET